MVGDHLRNNFINNIAKTDWSEVVQVSRVWFLRDESYIGVIE